MTARHVAADALLFLGVAVQLFAVVGVVLMRDAFDRLHYAAAGTTFGPFLVAASLIVAGTAGEVATKSVIVALVLVVGNPVVTHATGRAARVRARGALQLDGDDVVFDERPAGEHSAGEHSEVGERRP